MSLVFSGGTIVDTTFNLGTTAKKKALYDGVEAALTTAGWTITPALPTQTFVMNNAANAVNNETIVALGKTYTFKTSINNANDGEVLVGGTGVDSYTNLIACINLTAGSGTTYSTATTAGDGTITAQSLAGTGADSITYTANSDTDAGGALSDTVTQGSWTAITLSTASFDAETAETPDYLTCRLGIIYNGEGGDVTWVIYNRDKSTSEGFLATLNFIYTDNADQRIIASKYGFWCFKPGGKSDFTAFAAHQLSIPEPMRCKKITAATNATPIAITTNVAHGYTTGDTVKQLYVAGNTAANGTFVIVVTGPTTYTCTGSIGNGAMTGTRGVVGNTTSGKKEIFEYAIAMSAVQSGGGEQFRETITFNGESPGFFNGTSYATTVYWQSLMITRVLKDNVTWPWYNDAVLLDTPVMAVSEDAGTTWKGAGQLYNTAVLRQSIPMDQPVTDASGNSWLTLTDSYADGTFMVLVS